ncbi:MAG: iron-containing alcohol dehydrogenase [Bacteroidales bacterium]
MENFISNNTTALHFGKGVVDNLAKTLDLKGRNVLIVYGKGSVKRSGLFDNVMGQLVASGAHVAEFGGIKPNPLVEDVENAAALARAHNTDLIIAIGGGSVIDSAKIISITIPVGHPAWNFYTRRAIPKTAVPLVAILTLAATGTEMNPFAVLQNLATGQKEGYGHPLCYPKHSFLDPTLTITVPKDYTAYGVADLIAHCLEAYFGKGDCPLSDRFIFAIIGDAMEHGPQLLDNLTDYDLRAKIMYDATMALNGLTTQGKVNGDWGVHGIGHILSLLYDTPHGASLTIAYPAWMKLHREKAAERISKLGTNLFGTADVDKTIKGFEDFFRKISCPVRLSDAGILNSETGKIISCLVKNNVNGSNYRLTETDYQMLLSNMQA